jgi:hypothetical protein
MLMGAANRDRGKDHHRLSHGDCVGNGTRDNGVSGEGQMITMLFEAAYREERNFGVSLSLVLGGCGGQEISHGCVLLRLRS